MDIWNKVLITVPHLPSTFRNSWPGPAARIMPLPLVGGTIWTGMGPQEEARKCPWDGGVLRGGKRWCSQGRLKSFL